MTDAMIAIRRVLERSRFDRTIGDGALSEMIYDALSDEFDRWFDLGYSSGENENV